MSDNWKDKYLNKLEQFDKKQKEWSNLEEFLRQTTSRLALAAEGNSKLLDEKLLILRKAIRKGESQSKLTVIMDVIATELVRLDKKKSNKPKGHAGFLEILVNALSITKDMDKKSKSIRKLLKAKNPPEDEVLAKEFSLFFDHCIKISYKNGLSDKDNNPDHKKQGLFGRLFNSTNDSIDDKAAHEVATASDQSEHPPVLSPLSNDHRQKIEKSVTESLHNILDSFVDSLDYPEEQKKTFKRKIIFY
jgi:DGC domain-containing protein